MFLDVYAPGPVAFQVNVIGTVNYNIQVSNDNPNDPTDPIASGSITWVDSGLGAQTGTKTFSLAASPVLVRVIQNSGNGSTRTVVSQNGAVPL